MQIIQKKVKELRAKFNQIILTLKKHVDQVVANDFPEQ